MLWSKDYKSNGPGCHLCVQRGYTSRFAMGFRCRCIAARAIISGACRGHCRGGFCRAAYANPTQGGFQTLFHRALCPRLCCINITKYRNYAPSCTGY